MTPRPARLATGIIGDGPMGCVLGRALDDAGHTVTGIAAWRRRTDDDLRARVLPHVPVRELDTVVRNADLLLMAVPEGEMGPLVHRLDVADVWRPGQIVLHGGFFEGVSLMPQAASGRILPLTVWPAVQFLGTPADLERFRGSPVLVGGRDELRPVGEALVIEMGAEPAWVGPAETPRVRAALALARAAMDVPLVGALDLLRATGMEDGARMVAAMMSSRSEALQRAAPHDSDSMVSLARPDVMRTDLDLLSDGLGPGMRSVQASLLRAAVTSAILEGRLDAGRMEEFLDVLGEPTAEDELE